ncbi:ROK family transcriptional regulator [Microbacterium suaedae]|uniref:ROK family transcriptional regulator n=1 Tax=Microbacterium suaedae TaxID=2067813 RepID=UPI000DA21F8D|nr:ROK family protein [Microbacterium suaedae]
MPGPGDVLELVRVHGSLTRGEVRELTGLSRMTVSTRIDALLDSGLLVEGEANRNSTGRPSRQLHFHTDHARILVASVDTTHTTVGVTDLAGHILAEERIAPAVSDGPETTLDAIAQTATRLIDREGSTLAEVSACGVSVPGPIDPDTRRPNEPPIMPGWDGFPIAERLQDRLGVAIHVSNDADAAALGEQRRVYPQSRSLCFVKIDTGIGSGIVLDGDIYRGTDGGSGDIGHIKLPGNNSEMCLCGATGCLASVASGRALARQLTEIGKTADSVTDVRHALNAGDPDAARLTQDAGRVIGEVLATVVSVLNPAQLVLGGTLAVAPMIAGVREALYPRSLPRATRNLQIVPSQLDADAALIGLSLLAVDEEYSAGAVNKSLTGS